MSEQSRKRRRSRSPEHAPSKRQASASDSRYNDRSKHSERSSRHASSSSSRRRHSRSRSRSRSPADDRVAFGQRSERKRAEKQKAEEAEAKKITSDMTPEEIMMAMGLPVSFGSTKGKKVKDERCNTGGAKVFKQRQFTQLMNKKFKDKDGNWVTHKR